MAVMKGIRTTMRDELAGLPIINAAPELLGFLDAAHSLATGDSVVFTCPRLVLARRILKLWRAWRGLNDASFNATIDGDGAEGILRLDRKRGRAAVEIPLPVYEELVTAWDSPAYDDMWLWLRGAWALRCSVYAPRNGYYVAIRVGEDDKLGRRLLKTLRTAGIVPRTRRRGSGAEFMLRSEEQIATCLSRMGCVRTCLALEEIAIVRSLKSRANKLVNCDSANIDKSLSAAREQLELVRKIESEGLWDVLPPAMAEMARARGENPSVSLRELGQMLSKPVSKSTVEYRWRRLGTIINDKS
ncbi:MAG: DNA-binding protein WhiA [Synergistaceae bacterium]|jgi:hypothetical protein|nr:DNA-binding protein WhiA [Synergistaceae bacterium]